MKICTKIVNMSNIPILSAPMSSPPHPSGRYSLRILLPEVRQTKASRGGALRSYRERLCVLTESVSAPLPRASQRSYRERLSAPIMIVLALLLRGINQPQSAQPPRGLHPTLSDNNHVKTCCLTNISLTLVQELDLLVSVSVTGTGTDIMIALAVAYTPTGCTGSR